MSETAARFGGMRPLFHLLFWYQGKIGHMEFLFAELVRGARLGVCLLLYQLDWIVLAAIGAPLSIWPGIVATIKPFRDLGHDPLLILPVLMLLSGGFALGYKYGNILISVSILAVYLAYVSGVKGGA